MQFGLWVEPEMVNMDSDLARAHPEWVMQTGGRLPVESRHQQVLNLAIPQAYAQVRDQLSEILRRYEIDYLKWDHNRDLVDAGLAGSGRPAVHAQTLAAYRLMDELRAVRPAWRSRPALRGCARRPRGLAAHRPGLGVRLHRRTGTSADRLVDQATHPTRTGRLAYRLGPVPHHRTHPRAADVEPPPSSGTWGSNGTSPKPAPRNWRC